MAQIWGQPCVFSLMTLCGRIVATARSSLTRRLPPVPGLLHQGLLLLQVEDRRHCGGLGHTVALHRRSSALCQMCAYLYSVPLLLRRPCARPPGRCLLGQRADRPDLPHHLSVGPLALPLAFSTANRVCAAVFYGRAGRLAAPNGDFRPGQSCRLSARTTGVTGTSNDSRISV